MAKLIEILVTTVLLLAGILILAFGMYKDHWTLQVFIGFCYGYAITFVLQALWKPKNGTERYSWKDPEREE